MLDWFLTWGKYEEKLKEEYQKTGKMPKALANKPEIPYWARDFFEAFLVLSRHRQINQIEQPVSVSDMVAYATQFGFNDEVDSFILIIGKLDQHFLHHAADKRKQEMEEAKRKQKKK